ncbi:MAG: hypothetical protein KA243_04725 [Candidatus Aminicenantes bacterium]|nr:hypothetical protein [Candidatus Aminicenantes bacterium]NLH76295.1 hypothetical protein [Acidobacteriota bacterium]
MPPAVDLAALGTIGIVTLDPGEAKGDLDAAATQYFLEEVTAAQRVPVVELGPAAEALAKIGKTAFDRDAALALGQQQGLEAFFVGEIRVTKVKPQIDLAAPLSKTLFARTAFDIAVKVRLVSTRDGATLWTQSATREGTVGSVGMDNGVPVFSVRDKSAAMAEALRDLAFRLTWDFRPTRRRL